MKECPVCRRCFPDQVNHCPDDGDATTHSIAGEPILDGRYQLEKRIGHGGMGVVYQARHIFLKTAHAIKVILPDLVGNDPMLVTRFRQEALAAAAIRHQNIIAVTDFGVVRSTMPFLVMEFVSGKSLHDMLAEEGALPPARALEIISAVGAGVAAAHRQGIVHRDLKPLNIMFQEDLPVAEGLKVLDFGLAKIKSGELLGSFVQAKTSGLMGSPFYMAPEQWGDEEPDARADIYSLGVILYQMLGGDVPFKGTSIPSIMKKHLTTAPPSFASLGVQVPPQIEAVVRHALEKEAENRPASVEDFINELRDAINTISASLSRTSLGSFASQAPTVISAQGSTSIPPDSTTIRIRTNPPGSRVYINNVSVGMSDDAGMLVVPDMLRGEHRVHILHDGYAEWEQRVECSGGVCEVEARLQSLMETSVPPPSVQGHQSLGDPYAGTISGSLPGIPHQSQAAMEAQRLRQQADELEAQEERERLAREEQERRQVEEATRLQAEEEAQARAAEEERLRAEEEARLQAEAEAQRLAAEEAERLRAAEARKQAEEAARLKAEEEARLAAAAEAAERRQAEEEAARLRAEEEERQRVAAEERRQAEEVAARLKLEQEAARQRAEEKEARRLEEERRAEEERLRLEEEARQRAEAEKKRAEEARLAAEAEEQRRIEEERARQLATEQAAAMLNAEAVSPVELEAADETIETLTAEEPPVVHYVDPLIERHDQTASGWIEVDVSDAEIVRHAEPIALTPVEETNAQQPELLFAEPVVETTKELEPSGLEPIEEPVVAKPVSKEIDFAVTEKGVTEFDEFSAVPGGILKRLGSESTEERASAVADLARVGSDDSFRQINAAFDDPAVEVRNAAARSLFSLNPDRAATFTRALRESPPERRRKIGSALASSGLASEAIGQLMGESREKTYDAFSLLFLMSKAGEVQPLMRAIEEHPNNEVRLAVVKLLALSGQQEILPAFRRLAVRGSLPTEVRSAVMEAIYQISSQSPTPA